MRALLVKSPGQLELAEVPSPKPTDYDAMVQMRACGICTTTDRMVRQGSFPNDVTFPTILGHESIGEVTWVGSKVRNLSIGDKVTRASAYIDGEDAPLRQHWGGFAELGLVRDWEAEREDGLEIDLLQRSLRTRRVPPLMDPVAAALAICLSETRSTIDEASMAGARVLVVGTGVAGLSFVDHVHRLGAQQVVVVGRRESRLEVARQLGATLTILASDPRLVDTVKESTAGGVDIAFEASGDPSMVMTAAQCCRPGGLASVYGLSDRSVEVRWDLLPPDVSIRAPSTNEGAMYPLVAQELLSAPNRTWEYVSHVSSLSDFEAAVARCDAGQSLKTIITFDTD